VTPSQPRRSLRLRLIPTLATLAGLALLLGLGQWQCGKALAAEAASALREERLRLPPETIGAQLLDPQRAAAARYSVRGNYLPALQFYIDNRQEGGVAGVHVVTPLQIEGSDTLLLVNRGWAPWPHGRGVLPEVATPPGIVQLSGLADVPSTKAYFLMPQQHETDPRLWMRVDIARFAALAAGKPVQPVVLLQDGGASADQLVRHWPAPEDRSVKHRGYALQWWGMAAALLVFYLVTTLRRAGTTDRAAADGPA
jgi:surfeit locus 1 family protein